MTSRVLWLHEELGLGGAERRLTLMAFRCRPGYRHWSVVAYVLPWKDVFVGEHERLGR